MTTAMLKLYEIADQYVAVGDALIEAGGELTPELAAQLAAIDGAFEDKVEKCLLYALNLQASAATAMLEADRLRKLADSWANAAARLKDYVKREMERCQRPKIETDRLVARIQQNSQARVSWTRSIEELPERFVRVVRELDAVAARAAIKAGEDLPDGFVVERGSHLRVS